jgi:hypothetical protein
MWFIVAAVICCAVYGSVKPAAAGDGGQKPYTVDLTKGYHRFDQELYCDPDSYGHDWFLDLDGDGTDDVMFTFDIVSHQAGDPFTAYAIPVPGCSVKGTVSYTWPADASADFTERYPSLRFVFPEREIKETYTVTIEGGTAKDINGGVIHSAVPGQKVQIVPDVKIMKGKYVSSWKEKSNPAFAADFVTDANRSSLPYAEFIMPASDIVLTPVTAAQTPKTFVIDMSGNTDDIFWLDCPNALQICQAAGLGWEDWDVNFYIPDAVDADGDGWTDLNICPLWSGNYLAPANYRSATEFVLSGANSSPYSPITIRFADGNKYPFEADLSDGWTPGRNEYYDYHGQSATLEWLKRVYGSKENPNLLDFDRDGNPDCYFGRGKDCGVYMDESPCIYILETYSLGDVYTLPKEDDPDFIPFTFTLRGKGVHSIFQMPFIIDLSNQKWKIPENASEAVDTLLATDDTLCFWAERKGDELVFRGMIGQLPENPEIMISPEKPVTIDGLPYTRITLVLPERYKITVTGNGYAFDLKSDLSTPIYSAMSGDRVRVCIPYDGTPGGYFVSEWTCQEGPVEVIRNSAGEYDFIMPNHPVTFSPVFVKQTSYTIDLSGGFAEFGDDWDEIYYSLLGASATQTIYGGTLYDINWDDIPDIKIVAWEKRIYPLADRSSSCGKSYTMRSPYGASLYRYYPITVNFGDVEGEKIWIAASPTPRPNTPTPTATPTEALGEPTVTPSETKDDKSVNPLFIIIPTSVFVFSAVTAILLLNRRRKVK